MSIASVCASTWMDGWMDIPFKTTFSGFGFISPEHFHFVVVIVLASVHVILCNLKCPF